MFPCLQLVTGLDMRFDENHLPSRACMKQLYSAVSKIQDIAARTHKTCVLVLSVMFFMCIVGGPHAAFVVRVVRRMWQTLRR